MSRIITHFAVVFFCFFLSTTRTRSQYAAICTVSENLTRTELSNRDTVLSNLRDRSSLGSYSNATAGLSPNSIYGMFLCIGEINRASCSKCVQTATLRIVESCDSRSEGFAIYFDECIVRYSNFYFFTLLEGSYMAASYDRLDSNSTQLFNETLPGKLDEFILRASSSSRIPYFVKGKERVNQLGGSFDLEVMVQCSPDLDPRNCTMCLRLAVKDFFHRNNARSAQIFSPKCLLKYNTSTLQTSLGVTKGNEIFGRTFTAIMIASVLALMGL